MDKYHKIDTIFQRDTQGTKSLVEGLFQNETVQFLANNPWVWTEKVDGTNIRVCWDGHKVEFGGRTDDSEIPKAIVAKLEEYFGGEENAQLFEQTFGERKVMICGEAYGDKINKGKTYMKDEIGIDFIMFDLKIGDNYQSRESVERCAKTFGVEIVPIVGTGTLFEAVEYVKKHPNSLLANGEHEMEGLVCRPEIELNDRCHERIIVKVKWNDFKRLVNQK